MKGVAVSHGKYGYLIVFKDGHRIEKRVPMSKFPEAKARVKALKEQGIKAHLAYASESRRFPPAESISDHRNEGQLWCPYCGAWRWFKVPKLYPSAEIMTWQWYMNSFHNQNIAVCSWCAISTLDALVGQVNGIFAEVRATRKKHRNRKVTRRRVGRR